MWVEAHAGHPGNERADELAGEGAKNGALLKGYIPQTLIKQRINQGAVMARCNVGWAKTEHKHTALALGKNSATTKQDIQKLFNNRKDLRTAVQLISGHIGLNYHLNKMQISLSNKCQVCEDACNETVEHFLGQCPAYSQARDEFFNTFYTYDHNIFDNHKIAVIVKYANRTKRLQFYEDGAHSGVT